MKYLALIVALIGLSLLFTIFWASETTPIYSTEELSKLIQNQKVSSEGKVIQQRPFGKSILLKLDNDIELLCSSFCHYSNLLQKNISIEGSYDDFLFPKIKINKFYIEQ